MKITAENLKETTIEVELYVEDNRPYIFISHEGSSGCKYPIGNTEQLGNIVAYYVEETLA